MKLPVQPRLGRLLLEGQRLDQPRRVALAAALLAERDPFGRDPEATPATGRHRTLSDVLDRIDAVEEYERSGRTATAHGTLHHGAVRFLLQARDQLLRAVRDEGRGLSPGHAGPDPDEVVLRALLAAFPDRVARRRAPGARRGVMVGGRGVSLAPASGVTEPELFVCVDVDASHTEAWVRQASAVQRDWLPPTLFASPPRSPSTRKPSA